MTYLRASNNKLIDRAIRYIEMILKEKGIVLSYTELCHTLFKMLEITPTDHSIVLATVAEVERSRK
jgi:N-acetylmuramic acid 6-phosphate etherase